MDLTSIAKKYGTPLLVTSENKLRENCRRLKGAFDRNYGYSAFKYAIKANPNPKIVSIIADEGFGADASSPAEIEFALASGMKRDDILFSPNYASRQELVHALKEGVAINFDDLGQFETLSRFGVPKVVSFRLNPGFGSGEFAGIVTGGPNAKFGIPPADIEKAYRIAKDEGVERFGIHMMTGSNVLDPKYFADITSKMLKTAGRISKSVGIGFEFVDIGGGFGVPYRMGENELDIERTARVVAGAFREGCERYGLEKPRLMVEPGRYLVADTTVLLGTVNHVKRYAKTFIGTDVGMNTLLRPALYGAYHEVALANRMKAKVLERASVTGEICENTDVIANDRMLPVARDGDVVAFFNAGAYVYGMSSNYNSRPRPAEALIRSSGRVALIRRHETTKDLFSTLV